AENVHAIWQKALNRRESDPEGAITAARTLVETVCKYILDDLDEAYGNNDDLPKLYGKVSKALHLAPSDHESEPIKAILVVATTVVNGLGTLRNRFSDSHGRGKKHPVRVSTRHATLAVNMAGTMATFLVETYLQKKQLPLA